MSEPPPEALYRSSGVFALCGRDRIALREHAMSVVNALRFVSAASVLGIETKSLIAIIGGRWPLERAIRDVGGEGVAVR